MEKNDKHKLNSLAELLQQLKLTTAEESNTIENAQNIVNELLDKDNIKHQVKQQKKKKPKRGQRPEVGDKVTIVNPRGTQPTEGTVIGYTKGGFIKVKGNDGQIVRRIALNLIIQN
jgi:hypothetical protein